MPLGIGSGELLKRWGTTKKVKNLIKKYSRGVSLDAGCGEGIYHKLFRGNIIAIDLTLSFLLNAKNANKQHEYVLSSIKCLPFKNGVFDYTFCSQVIEHIHEHDCNKAIRELERVTKENGTIQIDLPNENLLLSILRKVFFKSWKYDENCRKQLNNDDILLHHSTWTKNELKSFGYNVKGCLGWVTQRHLKSKGLNFIGKLYDMFIWNIPSLAGTLIGFKKRTGETLETPIEASKSA